MQPSADQPTPWGRIALVWLAFCVILLAATARNLAEWRFPDPDDTLRLVQVRDLLAGQGWFDLHQYRINPGDSPVMHWSRLVDAPLALLILLLTPLLGQAGAEHVTVAIVPLLTLGAIMAVVGWMAFRLFGKQVATVACIACALSPPLVIQVQPLRIDHHGWQVFAVIFAAGALMRRDPRSGGALAGLAIAAGLAISLEVLPLAAVFGAVLLLRWLRDPAQRGWLPAYLASLAASLTLIFALTRGADWTQYCDAVAPAHLAFFAIVALASLAIAARPGLRPPFVVAMLGIAGAAGVVVFLAQAPQCLSGPFGSLDPLVRDYWYVNVLEGRPFWDQKTMVAVPGMIQGALALGILVVLWWRAQGALKSWWLDYLLLFCGALLGGMAVWRSMDFVGALAALPIGWLVWQLLQRFRLESGTMAKLGLGLAAIVAVLPGFPVVLATMAVPAKAQEPGGQLSESTCELRDSAARLGRFPAATIFAPMDIGPGLLEQTHHSVVATSHHRAQLAMHDVIQAFISPEAQARAIVARHKVRWLVVCTDLAEARLYAHEAPDGLMAELFAGRQPSWLKPVRLGTPETFKVWQVAAE